MYRAVCPVEVGWACKLARNGGSPGHKASIQPPCLPAAHHAAGGASSPQQSPGGAFRVSPAPLLSLSLEAELALTCTSIQCLLSLTYQVLIEEEDFKAGEGLKDGLLFFFYIISISKAHSKTIRIIQ